MQNYEMDYVSPADGDEYKTRDLYEAALIHSFKQPVLRTDKEDGVCYFTFENRGLCEKIAMDYRNRALMVNAKGFIESLKTMKDFIYNGERR